MRGRKAPRGEREKDWCCAQRELPTTEVQSKRPHTDRHKTLLAGTAACAEVESTDWGDKAPHPLAILCPVVRLLNIFVFSAGVFLVVFIFIAAIKYSLSQGDPKAVQASKQTLTTAIAGFIIIVGVYTIVTIIKNVLGLQGNLFPNPFLPLENNIRNFLNQLHISD